MSELIDYRTGEYIRDATEDELNRSKAAARNDGGAGVIMVDDYDGPVYVIEA